MSVGEQSRDDKAERKCDDDQSRSGQPQRAVGDVGQGDVIDAAVHVQTRNHDDNGRNGDGDARLSDFFVDYRGSLAGGQSAQKCGQTNRESGKVHQLQAECICGHTDAGSGQSGLIRTVEHQ